MHSDLILFSPKSKNYKTFIHKYLNIYFCVSQGEMKSSSRKHFRLQEYDNYGKVMENIY